MITGRHPWRAAITENQVRQPLPPDHPAVAAQWKAAGYQTAWIGKSHRTDSWDRAGLETLDYWDLGDAEEGDPQRVGYFRFVFVEERGLADEDEQGTRYPGQPGHPLERFVSRVPLDCSLENWTGDRAVRFLEDREPSRPFFLQLSFERPHEPLCVPEEINDWYDPASASITLSENAIHRTLVRQTGSAALREWQLSDVPAEYRDIN